MLATWSDEQSAGAEAAAGISGGMQAAGSDHSNAKLWLLRAAAGLYPALQPGEPGVRALVLLVAQLTADDQQVCSARACAPYCAA